MIPVILKSVIPYQMVKTLGLPEFQTLAQNSSGM